MKSSSLIWVATTILIFATIAVTFDSQDARGQEKKRASPQGTPPIIGPDLSKYGRVDFSGEESRDPAERERRSVIGKRYDNQEWVTSNPHPETGMIGRHIESNLSPVIPTQESDLIVTGTVASVDAYLSTDKRGVYSQFKINVKQVLKDNLQKRVEREATITIDRAGGVVRYPHGQTVLYLDNDKGLPEIGREYALFLKASNTSENYEILTLYELQETSIIPLDRGQVVEDIKLMGKAGFLRSIQQQLLRSRDEKKRRNP